MTNPTITREHLLALAERDSIYRIVRASPSFSQEARTAVSESEIDAALGALVPGGARVYCWLPMTDGHTSHQTARDVMRSALAAAHALRAEQLP